MTSSNEVGLSIIAPCYNEQDNIAELARRLASISAQFPAATELILVDDGSTDNTWLEIQKAGTQYPFVVPVRHAANAGIVAGWKSGLAASRGARVVTIDADLQYRPEDIEPMWRVMEETGADLVQGARTVEVKRSALRRILTAGLSWLLNIVFGMRLQDNKSGFILYRREVMEDVLHTRFRYNYFQHFVAVSAHAKGYRIKQVPIVFDTRYAGASFIQQPLRFSLRSLVDLPRALWEFRLGKKRTD